MKITLVISSLSCGGGERALVLLAEGLAKYEHQITLITFSDKDTDFYQLPSTISRVALGIKSKSSNILDAIVNSVSRILTLREVIESTAPDIVISSLRKTNIQTILALLGKKCPVIATEQNDVKVFSYGIRWETLRRFTYLLSSQVVSVSQGVNQGIDFLPDKKRSVIYNPIKVQDDQTIPSLPIEINLNKNWIVSMGRLTDQKGYDLLIQAFKKISDKHLDWQLLILGKGELREQLEQMKDNLDLKNQVVFTGALSNPFAVMKKAKIFVMASRNEGFPLAHGEALACGLPVIATDCPSGPREMIRHEVDGLLVANKNIEELAIAMDSLMSDELKRRKLSEKAPEVISRFGQEKIVAEWETLIQKLVVERVK